MRDKNNGLYVKFMLVSFALIFALMVYGFYMTARPIFEDQILDKRPKYHFYMVAPNSVDPFWMEVRRGAQDAAKQYRVALEFNAPRFNDTREEIKYLDIAVTSKVNGIVTHVSNNEDFTALIEKAYEKGIPVVTVDNDAKQSRRKSFVGTNSFVLGEEAGKLMVEATGGRANIAVIMSSDVQKDTSAQDLKLNGFLNAIKDYPGMKVVKIFASKLGILSAEEITQSIINSSEKIDAIYCMDSVDTVGAAQTVVDFNRVGYIKIVGYGDTPDIMRYIDKGIIYGTVMSDPYKMGYESIKTLFEIREKGNASTFIDTGVKVITKSNG
ncbi:substrate-binding domain-containing protein [Thermosediminibacter litoriperuensis]|uniref:Monosaccharide ABC transporter substrate-binding protein (CUT2 family) n=1 Tax=Thermosediminibacter litoriperuensis TaxID=291989 RepID=A0A5S5AV51_9FIRM|nr:substrate-binding domain-containing protein [Thermosediminibacter litoriperuensis]TYP56770.1 monosaccharide ABC transporter substrate-binding protein (CUT2 family) [Thermosediminibacter litoriperuensis]